MIPTLICFAATVFGTMVAAPYYLATLLPPGAPKASLEYPGLDLLLSAGCYMLAGAMLVWRRREQV